MAELQERTEQAREAIVDAVAESLLGVLGKKFATPDDCRRIQTRLEKIDCLTGLLRPDEPPYDYQMAIIEAMRDILEDKRAEKLENTNFYRSQAGLPPKV